MKENKDISAFDDIFKQQLENASATPPAGVWEGISSSLASTGAATVTSAVVKTALWVKIGIGVIASAAIASVVYIAVQKNETTLPKTAKYLGQGQEVVNPQKINPELDEVTLVTVPTSEEKSERKIIKGGTDVRMLPEAPEAGNASPDQTDAQGPLEFNVNLPKEEKPIEVKDREQPLKIDNTNNPAEPATVVKSETPNRKVVDTTGIFIPDVFTPNGDGFNDVYKIDIRGEESVRIMIYNINEIKVFETTNKYVGWNCTMPGGEPYPAGSYIVKVIYKFPGKQMETKILTLKLIR